MQRVAQSHLDMQRDALANAIRTRRREGCEGGRSSDVVSDEWFAVIDLPPTFGGKRAH